jgi:hypothetical protein
MLLLGTIYQAANPSDIIHRLGDDGDDMWFIILGPKLRINAMWQSNPLRTEV